MVEMKVRDGYKKTEVGVIPKDWEVKKLMSLSNMKSGSSITSKDLNETDEFPCYGGNGLRGYTYSYTHNGEFDLIGRQGALCGNVQYVEGKFFASEHAVVVTPNNDTSVKWLYYKLIDLNLNQFSESSAQPGLTVSKIETIKIAVPQKKSEQKAIAAVLTDVDEYINLLIKLIDKKKKIKQGTMQQLLTGKKRLPGFSGEWEDICIKDLLDYEQPTKYIIKSDILDKGTIPVLTANKSFILGFTEESFGVYEKLPVIIFDDFTTLSKKVNFKFKVKSSAMKMLKAKSKNINLDFLYEIMQLIKFTLGDHKRYYLSEYQYIKIKLPNLEEQNAIFNVLGDMDSEIEALEQKLEKYKKIKQGMMQELLTGRIRLI